MRTLLSLVLLLLLCAVARADVPAYETHFDGGLDGGLMLQAPRPDCIQLVAAPGRSGRALRIALRQDDNYAGVANGVPRAEVSFGTRLRLRAGIDYTIRWSMYLPPDFKFDARQPEGLAQIHGGAARSSPPFGLTLNGDRWQVDVRSGAQVQHFNATSAAADRGRWVVWSLRYLGDPTGARAVLELSKDDVIVVHANGVPNATAGDDAAYFKYGVYKWWWQQRPSDVRERVIYLGDVRITSH